MAPNIALQASSDGPSTEANIANKHQKLQAEGGGRIVIRQESVEPEREC